MDSLPDKLPALAGVAYFSMEIGLEPQIPTYSAETGSLAGRSPRGNE